MTRSTRCLTTLLLLAACSSGERTGSVNPAASVTVTPATPTVGAGRTLQLTVVVRDSSGSAMPQAPVTWAVTDLSVAVISAGGLVTGGVPGTTTVTAASGAAADTIPLTVTPAPPIGPPVSVVILPNPATVLVGDSLQLTTVIKDSSGTILTGVAVGWQSGDVATATISSSGVLHGVAQGSTTVTATAGSVSGQATVSVQPRPTGSLHTVISSFLGGTDEDMIRDVTVDGQGNMILVGGTASADFPTTPGVFGPTFNCCGINPHDAWITKLAPGGAMLWSSYLGGINYERGYAAETDPQGNIYVVGRGGAGFPTTTGVLQPTFGGGSSGGLYGPQDAFICKIKADGTAVVWCTYFGSSDNGILRDVAIDANGDLYVGGGVSAPGFPAAWFTNAYQKTIAGSQDIIVAKIKGDGSRVLWATYLGGSGLEVESVSLRLDPQGNVVVLTNTSSRDIPLVNPAKSTLTGPSDMYLAKLSPDGSQLLYATYLGGSGNEASETHGLWLDAQGNAFVAAQTSSTNIVTSPTGYQPNFGGGASDNIVWKVSPAGAVLASTYVGGSGGEGPEGAGVDGQGNFYFAANTNSANFPLTVPSTPGGLDDLVGVKLSSDLSQLLFSARFGGVDQEIARSALVDALGNFYLVGHTRSSNYPRVNATQQNFGGLMDGIFVKIAP